VRDLLRAIVVAAAVAGVCACGSDKTDSKAKRKPGDRDWASAPLNRVRSSVKKVAFSIEVPDGMRHDTTTIATDWFVEGTAHLVSPMIHVAVSQVGLPRDADAAASRYMMKSMVIRTKQALPGGYLVVYHNAKKSRVGARVYLAISDRRTLFCEASQARPGGVPNAANVMDWLATVCRSLKLER